MDNQHGNLQWQDFMLEYFEPLAYSIGALLGDGSVKTRVNYSGDYSHVSHVVTISNMDTECINRVCIEINTFFSEKYRVDPYKNDNGTMMYRFTASKAYIYELFHYFIGEKLLLPVEVFKTSRVAKLNFLAGLFDTDGYVATSNGYYRVGYAARFRTLVEDVARLMQKLGVKVGKIHEQVSGHGTTMYVIKPSIKSFIDSGCYFQISRKAQRLSDYQGTVKPSETIMPGP